MRPVLTIIGLVLGALIGGYLATTFGADFVSKMEFESPDEQGATYNMMFLGLAAISAAVGAVAGLLVGMAISED